MILEQTTIPRQCRTCKHWLPECDGTLPGDRPLRVSSVGQWGWCTTLRLDAPSIQGQTRPTKEVGLQCHATATCGAFEPQPARCATPSK